MAFTKREKQILMGVPLEPLTGDEYALKRHVDELNEKELPAVTSDDDGSVLEVANGAWAKNPFIVDVEVALTTGEGTITVTLNKKAAELYNAVRVGKMVRANIVSYNGTAVTGIEKILPLMAAKDATGDTPEYGFSYTDEGGDVYIAEELAGTADVALTATVS